jgi:hypothetical protein
MNQNANCRKLDGRIMNDNEKQQVTDENGKKSLANGVAKPAADAASDGGEHGAQKYA